MKTTSRLRSFFLLSASSLLAISSASAATLYWDGTDTTFNADGGAGAWSTANIWDNAALAGSNATWTNSPADSAVFGGLASALVTTGAAITTSGIQFNTTGYTITATSTNTLSFSGTSNIIFNNIAAATITGTVTGSGSVTLSTTNPVTAGTLNLNGTSAGGWSGTTTINPGMTMSLSGLNQGLLNTSGITLNGGGITLTNADSDAERILDRVSANAITSNGGTITYTTTGNTRVFAETIGSVTLNRGQLNLVNTLDKSGGSQTLALSGLSQTGTSAITFSNAGGLNTTTDRIAVTGAGTTAGWVNAATSNSIHGPWATVGTAANAQTDYAVFSGDYVIGANTAGSLQGTWTDSTKQYTNNTSAVALSGNRTMNALRNTAATATITLSDGVTGYTLATNGILNGVSTLLTIAPGTPAGSLTAPGVSGGNIFLNAGSGAITVNAPINNNGGNVTVVKNGSGTLTLGSLTSNYSGGTVVNAGTLTIAADANLGNTSGGLTFNGTSAIASTALINFNAGRTITVNEGAHVTISGLTSNSTFAGKLTGSGAISNLNFNGYNFTATNNDFTGTINAATAASTAYGFDFTSIGDAVGSGLINLGVSGGQGGGTFRWKGSSGLTTTFNNRQFALAGATTVAASVGGFSGLPVGGIISALGVAAADNLVVTKDLLITGAAGSRYLQLTGTNLGNNTFSGNITDGTDGGTSVVGLIKTEAGKWILSGNNTYTGGTILNAGTLVIGSANALPTSGNLYVTGGTLESTVGTLTNGRFTATAGIFTASLGGSLGFNKFSTGTTNLNGTANVFTGGITVGGGTLAVGASSSLGQNVIGNSILIRDGGILTLAAAANSGSNQAITLSSSSKSGAPVSTTGGGAGPTGRLAVLGLGFNGLPNGAISQANTNGGVIAINNFAGYNTDLSALLSGKNLFLGGIGTTSTFTGAAGTVVAGNGSLYRLGGGGGQITFNTTNLFTSSNGVQVGSTLTNGGGTVVISAAQDYSGTTAVSQGTLTLSGANGTAIGSSGFTLNGGRLFLDSSTTNNADRIGTVAVALSNGGELSLSGNAAGTTEVFNNLSIGAGYSTVTATAVTAASTLSGTGFSRTNNGTALFRGTALGTNITVMGKVTLSDTSGLSFVGASTLANAASGDTTKDVRIVPYLVGGTTGTDAGSTFVTYDTTHGFRALNTANQFNTTVTAATNVRLATLQTGIATTSINSLIIANTGSSTIADGATLTVASGAVLFSSAGTIAPAGTTGILDFGTAEGIVTTPSGITGIISARITGSGGLTKSGTGQLTLSNTNNSFNGGIVVNGGTLAAALDTHLGNAANTITFNGHSTFSAGTTTFARNLILNNGAIVSFGANLSPIFSGNVTGTGGVAVTGGFGTQVTFNGTANAFEGPIVIAGTGTVGDAYRMVFASLADSASANGRIVFAINSVNHANGSVFEYTGGTGGNTNLVLNNRQIELASTTGNPVNGHQIRNNSAGTGTLTIATDLIVSTPIEQTLALRGSNTGANTFSGVIGDGDGKVSVLKADAGTWLLNGNNTYTGLTSVNAGTLGGTGTIAGSVTVAAAGSLAPGASAGTLSIGGGLDISAPANGGAGKLKFELGANTAASDQLAVTGTLTIGSGVLGFSDFTFSDLGWQNGAYVLITSGGISGTLNGANLSGTIGVGGTGTLSTSGNNIVLTITGLAGGPGPLDNFLISAISSPQTVGTPITGITLTARDASNATVTSFTGTVNFGGTGGFSGTSATFTAGVLSGVSVTPTNAGSSLTFTVTDIGTGKTGSATITTIQTQYQFWAGGALFDADANGDGVKNGMAFLLGASGPSVAVIQPTVTQSGGNLVLSNFSSRNLASRGTATLSVQHSSDLGIGDPWTTVLVPEATAAEVSGVSYNITPGSPLNTVNTATISVSQSAAGKLFGRLKANQ